MASPSEKVIELRQLLAERFRQAQLPVEESYATGLPALDEVGMNGQTFELLGGT